MAVLAVTGDVGDDQLGIDRPHRLIVESPIAVGTRLGTFHPKLGGGDETEKQLAAARLREVEGDAEHVAPLLDPSGSDRRTAVAARQLVAEAAPTGVAALRLLDMDHLGAHLAGELGRERLGDKHARGNDANSLQRPERLGNQTLACHMRPSWSAGFHRCHTLAGAISVRRARRRAAQKNRLRAARSLILTIRNREERRASGYYAN